LLHDDETTDREELLDEIIARYLETHQAGEEQSQAEFLARYPQYKEELREFFENQCWFDDHVLPPDDSLPCFGDDYEVLEEIGHGGMGVVYKAHQKSLNKIVAIKTIRKDHWATDSDTERIRKEAQRAAKLRHPNIVTVHHVAVHEDQHFFVMDYIEGRNLAQRIDEGPLSSVQAAHYLKTVAEAIHYAHQRRILHSDLKPGNILLDQHEKPLVTDFGLAKQLGDASSHSASSAVGGTAGYMAPEQASGDELTTATDVYGLGALLYALLTGHAPFRGQTFSETLRLVKATPPESPSKIYPHVDPDLEAICLKCLRKSRDERYGSAEAMAEDLTRYQSSEETSARPWSLLERIIGWFRRNPVVAGSVAAVITIAILTIVMSLQIAQARKDKLLAEALDTNTYAAKDVSTAALLQLRDLSDAVELASSDSSLVNFLAKDDREGLQRYLEQICNEQSDDFASCFIIDSDGVMVARVQIGQSPDEDFIEQDFSWRDYFIGAKAHRSLENRTSFHISSVYRGRIDDLYKFAISAPIMDSNERFLGVIATSVTTNTTMGLVHLEDPGREVVLIAPKDAESTEADTQNQPGSYVVLFHPAYHPGVDAVEFPDTEQIVPRLQRIHTRELDTPSLLIPAVDNYFDPVRSLLEEYDGRWIAGFAAVGHTGFGVIVQQRFEEALELDPAVSRNLLLGSILVSGLALAIVIVVLWRWTPSRRVSKNLLL